MFVREIDLSLLRKLTTLVCLVAVLAATLNPSSPILFYALVVPVLLLAGLLSVVRDRPVLEQNEPPVSSYFRAIGSRAPPALASLN
jgi:hypothetical protein